MLSPPDSGHVHGQQYLLEGLAQKYQIDCYGVIKHQKTIEKTGATFYRYPESVEEHLWLASPYNLLSNTPQEKRLFLIQNWEAQKEKFSFVLINWLLNMAKEYQAVITDHAFYQRSGFAIPYVSQILGLPLIGTYTGSFEEYSFNSHFLPEKVNFTLSDPMLFHLGYQNILNFFNTIVDSMIHYLHNNNIEVYFSSREYLNYVFSGYPVFLGNRFSTMQLGGLDQKHQFLHGDLIYFSLDTVCNHDLTLFETIISTLNMLPYKSIISSGGNYYVYDILHEQYRKYGNIEIYPFVNQLEVLSEAKIFITHAGAGSVYEGIYLGTPLICIPQNFDQPYNAKKIVELGLGVSLNQTEKNIAAQLTLSIKNLEDNWMFYMTNIENMRQTFLESNSPEQAVQNIEALLFKDTNLLTGCSSDTCQSQQENV